MLGKIKRALGIEGVRVDLICDDHFHPELAMVDGVLKFTTKSDGKVRSFRINLIESYTRGRKGNKLTDEYILGEYSHNKSFEIKKEEIIEIPFSMKYDRMLSEMDRLQKGNIFTGMIIGLAKKIKGVKSSFKITVTADIVGTKLDPYTEKVISFK